MIFIDNREDERILKMFPKDLIKVQRLVSGDYKLIGSSKEGITLVGIERKTISDFMGSMRSGRLMEQLTKMAQEYNRIYVMIEGFYKRSKSGNLEQWRQRELQFGAFTPKYSELQGYMWTLREKVGIEIVETNGMKDSADKIISLHHWWENYDVHHSHERIHTKTPISLTLPSIKQCIAAQLPGIGDKMSKNVAKHFPTIKAMMTANESDWQEIEGIGKTIANKIIQTINGGEQ